MESTFSNVNVDIAVKAAQMALSECEVAPDPFEAESLAWIADKCATKVEAEAEAASTAAAHAVYGHRRAMERAWQAAGCREACYHPPDNQEEKACSEYASDLASRARLARKIAQLTRGAAARAREAVDGTAGLADLEAALAFDEAFEKAKARASHCLSNESLLEPRSREYSAALAALSDARAAAANSEDLKKLSASRRATERRILDAVQGSMGAEAQR